MRAIHDAAQARSSGFGTFAAHQCSLAAIHSIHWLAHAAFTLAKVQRHTSKRTSGEPEQED
jgi:hypothetical protein